MQPEKLSDIGELDIANPEMDRDHHQLVQLIEKVGNVCVAHQSRVFAYLPGLISGATSDSAVEHHCSASIGVTLFINHEASLEDILKWADNAVYQAKEAGRNSIRFHISAE